MSDLDRPVLSDPGRLAALSETGLMDAAAQETLERFARLARATLPAPVALVSLVDDTRQFFAGASGLDEPRETPLSHSFCQHVVMDGRPLIVPDSPSHPKVQGNPVIEELGVAAYAGMPIRTKDGHVLGSFCAIDHQARDWTERELAILEDLAVGVSREIDLLRQLRRLELSERRMAEANDELTRSQSQIQRETRSTLHDLGTPLGILRMGVGSIRGHEAVRANPELAKLVAILERSCAHAAAIVEARAQLPSLDSRTVETLALAAFVRKICEDQATVAGPRVTVDADDAIEAEVSPTELQRCVQNLVSNARRFAESEVRVVLREAAEGIELSVADDGPGLPEGVRPWELFDAGARFHEGEGKSQSGLGLAIVRELVARHGGEVHAEEGELGALRVVIQLPRTPPAVH